MAPLKADHDAYWRLETYESAQKQTLQKSLKARNITFRQDVSLSELIEAQRRMDRGLLHYDFWRIKDHDLSRFINDRRLQGPTVTSRKAMIAVLVGADEAASFSRFTDLPPELRERIYGFHMANFPERLFCPTQPPIARVCKLLRQEALHVFHSLTCFHLRLYFVPDRDRAGSRATTGSLRSCFQTYQFLQTLRPQSRSVPRIGRLSINLLVASAEEAQRSMGKDIAVMEASAMNHYAFTGKGMGTRAREMMLSMPGLFAGHFNDGSASGRGFSLEDIYKMRQLIETAFFDTFKNCGSW